MLGLQAPMSENFALLERAIEDFRQGKIVMVVDDEDRENEGDFICAAQTCSPEAMNVMIRYGSGFVCAPTTAARLEQLQIPMMVNCNSSRLGTAMTVTVDAKRGTSTGVSASDRATTVRLLADPLAQPLDFTRPGHIVPLRAEEGGVLCRPGHTEAAVDLCLLAGLAPVGVLAEIMNPDGSLARGPELQAISRQFNLSLISIAELIRYRQSKTVPVRPLT